MPSISEPQTIRSGQQSEPARSLDKGFDTIGEPYLSNELREVGPAFELAPPFPCVTSRFVPLQYSVHGGMETQVQRMKRAPSSISTLEAGADPRVHPSSPVPVHGPTGSTALSEQR